MSNRKSATDIGISKQQVLFDGGLEEGCLDISLGLKQLVSKLMRGHDRYMIAAQISKATLKETSKEILDKKVSSDPAYQLTAIEVLAICKIIGNNLEPFRYLLEPLDSDVLNPEDRDLIDLARLQEQERVIKAKMDAIRAKRGLK